MALTPGGGRSSSTQPPPTPPTPTPPVGQPRPLRDGRPKLSPRATTTSVVRWGLLIGGLVIIADLAARAIVQRTLSPDDAALIGTLDDIANYVLFSILGIVVVRDTKIMYMGAIAGVFAALLDATVIAAAGIMAPQPGPGTVEEIFVSNLIIGTLFAGLSGVVYALVQSWSGGRRRR